MAGMAATGPAKARRRNPALARLRKFLEIPRVGFVLAQATALAGLIACLWASQRFEPVAPAAHFLGFVLPVGLLAWSTTGLVRRALATGFPGFLAAFAAAPALVAAGTHALGLPASAWPGDPAIWVQLGAGALALAIVPARRAHRAAGYVARLRVAVSLAFLGGGASAILPVFFPGLAAGVPLGLLGQVAALAGLACGLALALLVGASEPIGERSYAEIADREQAILTWLILLAALGWAAQAWHSHGLAWDRMALAPGKLLPTVVLYALPVVAFQWLVFGRRGSTKAFWAVALLVSAWPFVDWARGNAAVGEGIARHYASIASFPRREASPEILDVVFDLGGPVQASEATSALRGMRLHEIVEGKVAEILPGGGRAAEPGVPDRHFLVRPVPFPAGVPGALAMEVQQVDYGKATPLGLDVEARVREATFPPLPTATGWMTVERVLHETDPAAPRAVTREAKASAFVAAVLRGKAFVRNPAD